MRKQANRRLKFIGLLADTSDWQKWVKMLGSSLTSSSVFSVIVLMDKIYAKIVIRGISITLLPCF